MAMASGLRLRKLGCRIWRLSSPASARSFSSQLQDDRLDYVGFCFPGCNPSSAGGNYWNTCTEVQSKKTQWNLKPVQQLKCFISGSSAVSQKTGGREEVMATQMIRFAQSARNKGDSSYLEVLRVLEQGLSFFDQDVPTGANAAARVLFTMATLHADCKKLENAVEALERVMQLLETSLEVRVSALEALAGLKLRLHLDDDAAGLAQAGLKLVETDATGKDDQQLKFRTTMTRDLVKVASGDLAFVDSHVPTDKIFGVDTSMTPVAGLASAILALAECTHVQGRLLQAKSFYGDAINFANNEIEELLPALTAVSTTPEEVRVGALAGLGQLYADLSQFDEAERNLTEALKQAETLSGENHSRVGMVLSCMGHVYARRAKAENTGYLLAEGLYRRSLDLLEGPHIDNEEFQPANDLTDILALSRARYADLLATNNRTSESERLQSWANSSWKGSRPLDEVLSPKAESTIPKPLSVVEVRLGRVL